MNEIQFLNAIKYLATRVGNRVVRGSDCSAQKTAMFLKWVQANGIASREKNHPEYLAFVVYCSEKAAHMLGRNKENKKVRISSEDFFNAVRNNLDDETEQERFQHILDSPLSL